MAALDLRAPGRRTGSWDKRKGVLGAVLKDSYVVSLQINTAGIMLFSVVFDTISFNFTELSGKKRNGS